MRIKIIRNIIQINDKIRFALLVGYCRRGGISSAVRYLRNPNPVNNVWLLETFGASIGEGTTIKRSLIFDNTFEDCNSSGDFSHLRIGRNCYIGDGVFFDLAEEVVIGDNVVISGGVSILTHADCNRSPFLDEVFPRVNAPVRIRSGAWIGFNATILHGVTIGENSVVSACSLVKDDVDAYQVFSGIPAQKVRDLRD